ncbi:hypothetical protein MHYP_G00358860 [Metynnis hypsauchen]
MMRLPGEGLREIPLKVKINDRGSRQSKTMGVSLIIAGQGALHSKALKCLQLSGKNTRVSGIRRPAGRTRERGVGISRFSRIAVDRRKTATYRANANWLSYTRSAVARQAPGLGESGRPHSARGRAGCSQPDSEDFVGLVGRR